jgi:DNA ligase-1
MPALVQIETARGLFLPVPGIWLDPHRARGHAFVSHAHADHFARHERILCSEATGIILRARFGVAASRLVPVPFDEPLEIGGHQLRLLPAGHIRGSAMLHVTDPSGATLLYTGDFKVRPGLTAEAPVFREAGTLVMETTYGKPEYVFPSTAELTGAILNFVQGTLEDGEVPILVGYSLGKAQEAVALLAAAGMPAVLHRTVAEMTTACREAGADLPEPVIFDGEAPEGHVLVVPPNAVRSRAVRALKKRRLAMLSGWALTPGARYRYRTDEAFALSDHADYPGLLECVRKVQPRRILTIHGFTREFARDLREQGFDAWSVHGDDQIEMNLGTRNRPAPRIGKTRPACEMQVFSDLREEVARCAGRLGKIERIARFLRSNSGATLPLTVAWLSGRALPDGRQRTLSTGPAVIRQALLQATGRPKADYRAVSATQNDSARTARILLEEADVEPLPLSCAQMHDFFIRLSEARGSLEKTALLATLLRDLHPKEGETVISILTGDLRIGLKEGLLEDAVAAAFHRPPAAVRDAHMLLANIGTTAELARDDRLGEARLVPFAPLKCMLASPEATAESIVERRGGDEGPALLWVEEKYDGVRAQLHKRGEEGTLFSRDLRPLDAEFPELLAAAVEWPFDAIVDGEIIAHAEGRRLSFVDLQKRLGRTKGQGDLFLGEAVPVRFLLFDLLWHDGEDLLRQPLEERRRRLDSLRFPSPFEAVTVSRAGDAGALNRLFKEALARDNEGLIVKDPAAPYRPGRRGKSWLKLKGVMPTLDCVVVAAQQGHGKRAEWLSDYTFAVRDPEDGQLRTIGKAYSGLSDDEIEELTETFKKLTVSKSRRTHRVDPQVVLEIAFDSIRPSKRHDSGLALRFPRIKTIRRDKTPEEIDTLSYAWSLVKRPDPPILTPQ